MAEAREQRPARPFLSVFQRGDGRPGELRKWLAASGPTIALIVVLFFLALFVRAYFGHDLAQENGYLVSGGSDSYYWQRIIDYSSNTGKQLFWDPLINWPDGIRNPRPPMYSFSVVVPAVFTQGFFDSIEDAWGAHLMWSTALWGALTVVPTYFLGKEAFGRRAGLVAAFLLAVMPSHVQRSVLSDADHDAFILFFIVLTFYFVLKAVKAQQHKRWVENWKDIKSIRKGFGDYFRESRTAVLYAALAGVSYACIINAWVGFGYASVLILAYYVIQVLLNKFKNIDSMSVTMLIFVVMSIGFLLSYPVYYEQNLILVRFDIPVYLFLASMFFGGLFIVTRDYPWTMVLPTVGIILVSFIVVIDIVNPALAEAILSGQGYFVKSKLYSTIAEARAPVFSELALSFGMVTFFLSLVGMFWAIWKVPKKIAAEYIFMVVWLVAAIFMAISAGRFMFNASPAFAIAAGWVIVLLVDRLDFSSVRKSLMGASGSYWQIFKKSVKIRHIVGALFLGVMIVLPNVWYSVDAGIPSEIKTDMDKQIYSSLPEALRPSDYDAINGSSWYFGAFGYSIPLQRYYFPAAWEWFSEQDNTTYPVESRPAYVAWWDYGFEAIQSGKHPTVADNFQNGYQLTGNAIVSQSEEEAIAVFAYRLIQAAYNEGGDREANVRSLLESYGMSADDWENTISGPAQPIIDDVLADPATYGPMATDLTAPNARIVYGRVALVNLGSDRLVSFYSDLSDVTGWEIRYFNVDSRMFPTSASNTGIFYAPAKLADRKISGSSTPVNFFRVIGIDEQGKQIDIDNITSADVIVQYTIIYNDMFYDSMFYRAMAGYSGTDLGESANDGIPGLGGSGTGTMDSYQAMPAWNLTHFKMVYRTAYYNPYPQDELAGHADYWRALNLKDVIDLKTKIDDGVISGVVDTSAAALYSAGTVFLKYYDGAYVNGTLTTEEGYPVAGVRVTMLDEWGIPHDSAFTDAQGRYSVLAPFGEVTLAFTTGKLEPMTQTGETAITTMKFNVTDDQAMRRPYDRDLDGVLDYIITKDYVMKGTQITADVFWDVDGDGNFTAENDLLINNTVIRATELYSGQEFTINATDGTFDVKLPAGQYDFIASVLGRDLQVASKFNVSGTKTQTKLAIEPSVLNGHVAHVDGSDAGGLSIEMLDLTSGVSTGVTTDADGNYSFPLLLGGKYAMITTEPGYVLFNLQANISEGQTLTRNITIFPSANVTARITNDGSPTAYAVWMLVSNSNPFDVVSGMTDQFGVVDFRAPKGLWTLYASQSSGSSLAANAVLVDTTQGTEQTVYLDVKPAAEVSGSVLSSKGAVVSDAFVDFVFENGARMQIETNSIGAFKLALPEGNYDVMVNSALSRDLYSGSLRVSLPETSVRIKMTEGVLLSGSVWLLRDITDMPSVENLGRFAGIAVTDSSSRVYSVQANSEGAYSVVVPKGSTVSVSILEPGYSGWSTDVMITKATSSYGLAAEPDAVTVAGRLTSDGVGVRGVQVAFVPDDSDLDTVYATTGADGAYSAEVLPAKYTVSVDQATNPAGGERYLFSLDQIVTPSAESLPLDIAVTKKVQAYGSVLGGGYDIQIVFDGPEETTLDLSGSDYSVLLLPGEYEVYVTGMVSGLSYASMTVLDITASTRMNDLALERAYAVTGTITIPSGFPSKAVTVRATASDGTFVEVRSTASGRYALSLPSGDYALSYLLEDSSSQSGHVTFIEYSAQQTVQVLSSDVVADANLVKRLDNTTYTGTVVGPDGEGLQAVVQLTATGVYGQNITFTSDAAGAFNVSLQPGDYVMYASRLQDRHAALAKLSFSRNIPVVEDIVLSDAQYIRGKVTVGGVGVQISMTISTDSATITLKLTSDSDGNFALLAPPAEYTMASYTVRTENGVSVTYSDADSFTVSSSDVYISHVLQRQTKRGVIATWNTSAVQTASVGAKVSYAVTITNTGNIADRFLVTFTGTGFDVEFTPAEVRLGFGVGDSTIIIAEVTPKSTVSSGEQEVTCLVRSLDFATTRADLDLKVQVLPYRSVLVTNLGTSTAVNSLTTITAFLLNNTGNSPDDIGFEITNLALLKSLGWDAIIIDPATGEKASSAHLAAFGSKALHVKYTALRSDADASAKATVFAYSKNLTTANAYAEVTIVVPDLAVGKGDLTVTRDDVTLENDANVRLVTDIVLLAALVALVVTFYMLRRMKGHGKSSKGGEKK